ncbi:hypothetical protein CF168_07075 [Shewanella bicestrii]|uniref:Uncharacterized protein n=1 Tax=Shewanella bicestrii TaxID=2018305 RepID=A0A220ULA0_9GAMM|nr:hypothetical protein CF168_07075 [Shewanella bicestrii]
MILNKTEHLLGFLLGKDLCVADDFSAVQGWIGVDIYWLSFNNRTPLFLHNFTNRVDIIVMELII